MNATIDIDTIHGGLRWFKWRGLILLVVYLMGLVAFSGGVRVSDRDLAGASFAAKVYYTLGLFVLGGMDLGVPNGGPLWTRTLLWFTYFAAPAITTSALVEAVLRVLKPQRFRIRQMRNHIVIAGCGRLAMLYLERLRQVDTKTPLLIIDNRADNQHFASAAERFHATVVVGDLAVRSSLHALRLNVAKRLVLLTGDDYINLDAATQAIGLAPHLASRTLIHVGDIRLLRTIEEAGLLPHAEKFNTYQRAAQYLVTEKLLPHFLQTEGHDVVVLAGFGRFGQSVLAELQLRASGKFKRVIIVDRDGEFPTSVFAEQVGFLPSYQWELLAMDLQLPETWNRVLSMIGEIGPVREPVFVLGSGNDSVNTRTSLWLSQKYPSTKILARCFRPSTFANQISAECDFEVVSTSELLLNSMQPDWFADSG